MNFSSVDSLKLVNFTHEWKAILSVPRIKENFIWKKKLLVLFWIQGKLPYSLLITSKVYLFTSSTYIFLYNCESSSNFGNCTIWQYPKESVLIYGIFLSIRDSELQIALVALFSEMLYHFSNVVVAQITRESVQQAIANGITAQQVLSYWSYFTMVNVNYKCPVFI